jgi:hypothetical protein
MSFVCLSIYFCRLCCLLSIVPVFFPTHSVVEAVAAVVIAVVVVVVVAI